MRVKGYEQADAALAGDADWNAVRDIVELLSQSCEACLPCNNSPKNAAHGMLIDASCNYCKWQSYSTNKWQVYYGTLAICLLSNYFIQFTTSMFIQARSCFVQACYCFVQACYGFVHACLLWSSVHTSSNMTSQAKHFPDHTGKCILAG